MILTLGGRVLLRMSVVCIVVDQFHHCLHRLLTLSSGVAVGHLDISGEVLDCAVKLANFDSALDSVGVPLFEFFDVA